MEKEWIIAGTWDGAEDLARKLGVSRTIAQILYNRGITDYESARAFLYPKLNGLVEPDNIYQCIEASRRICYAINNNEQIVIYGDYDVDGIAGAAVLWWVLTRLGARVKHYVPHRIEEGYGLNKGALKKLIDEGMNLLITVDCGIRAVECVEFANRNKVDVIITDHHEPGDTLPNAYTIIHPALSEVYKMGEGGLPCGAAIAFKLAWAVARNFNGGKRVADEFRELMVDLTTLVALATVADLVPLVGENRILAKFGMEQMSRTKLPGVKSLIKSAGLDGNKIASFHLAFILAPRINAAGRMGSAVDAFELLTTEDEEQAHRLAKHLDRRNRERQKLEDRIMQEAMELAQYYDQLKEDVPILILAKENWHAGVIGIVASRLVERVCKPVVMIAVEGDRGQGSARSVEGYDINKGLEACSEYLIGFGGHSMAAGLRIETDKIIPFIKALQAHASKYITNKISKPVIKIDAVVSPEELTPDFVGQIHLLGPFGCGNPRPILATDMVELVGQPTVIGNSGKHLAFNVRWGNRVFRTVAFNQAEYYDVLLDSRTHQLAFEPIINNYNGFQTVQLRAVNIKPVK